MVTIRKPKVALKFSRPASWWGAAWREGLPTGNGVFGVSVHGGAGNDTIMVNHGDLWWQGNTGVLPDVADKIKDVKKLVEQGNPKEAQEIIPGALISKGYRPVTAVPLPLCDLKVYTPLEKPVKEYFRVVNMENGEVSVSFKDGNTRFDRSCFVSRAHNIMVYEITRTGNKNIDVTFSLDVHDKSNNRTPTALSKLPDGIQTKYENFFMYFSGRSDNGTEFGTVARITHYNGSMEVKSGGIRVKGAEKVLLVLKPYVESQREKEWKNIKAELSAIKLTYEKLLKEHTVIHSKLFGAVELDLETDDREMFMEDILQKSIASDEISNTLYEKLWAYGRYLFISATSESSHIAAPYGLWCGDYKAVNSEIRVDGSLQAIYSHALSGDLADYLLPIFTFYETMLDDLKKNAARLYGCRGIFIPAVVAPESGLLGAIDAKIINFSGCAGWIAQLFYDYYLYTGDVKFLKNRALPFMKEVALFYEEFFKVKSDGQYDTIPSYSPENNALTISDNIVLEIARSSTVDFAIAKELLSNLVKGCEVAGMYKSDVAKWEDMITRIPQYRFNTDGTIKEYIDNKYHDNLATRHLAHMYPVYPGTEVSPAEPELFKAYALTAKKRIVSAVEAHNTASFGRLANILARLNEGDTAYEVLGYIIKSSLMNNMITASNDWRGMGIGENNNAWANYTIEGNMSITSAMQEMLVNSRENAITLLPSLPSSWKKGNVSGLITRAGVTVDIDWDFRKAIINVKLKAKRSVTVDLVLPPNTKRYKGPKAETYSAETNIIKAADLAGGKAVSIEIRI